MLHVLHLHPMTPINYCYFNQVASHLCVACASHTSHYQYITITLTEVASYLPKSNRSQIKRKIVCSRLFAYCIVFFCFLPTLLGLNSLFIIHCWMIFCVSYHSMNQNVCCEPQRELIIIENWATNKQTDARLRCNLLRARWFHNQASSILIVAWKSSLMNGCYESHLARCSTLLRIALQY